MSAISGRLRIDVRYLTSLAENVLIYNACINFNPGLTTRFSSVSRHCKNSQINNDGLQVCKMIKSEFGGTSTELCSRAKAIAAMADQASQNGDYDQARDLIEVFYEIEESILTMKMSEVFSIAIEVIEQDTKRNFFHELLDLHPDLIMRAAIYTGACQMWWDAIVALRSSACTTRLPLHGLPKHKS